MGEKEKSPRYGAARREPSLAGRLAIGLTIALTAWMLLGGRRGSGCDSASGAQAPLHQQQREPLTRKQQLEQQAAAVALLRQEQQQQHPGLPGMAEVLKNCWDFPCLRAVHDSTRVQRAGARFNFPHFFIIGYHKAATTSLHGFLAQHQQILASEPKEPQFFTERGGCLHGNATVPWACNRDLSMDYIVNTLKRDVAAASGLQKAAFEASADYAGAASKVAMGIRREMPWLKLVVSLREPISREISGRIHKIEWLEKHPTMLNPGMLNAEQCLARLRDGKASMYECLALVLDEGRPRGAELDYSPSLRTWLNAYPREQIHVIQYEKLTAPETHTAVLADMQRFLGLDPELGPSELPSFNSRKGRNTEGWPMKREEYESLVAMARLHSYRTAELLQEYGYADAQQWLAPWEAAWQRNLDSCDEKGDCMIQLT